MNVRLAAVLVLLGFLVVGMTVPVLAATRPGSFVMVSVNPSSVKNGGVTVISMCMNDGLVGTIATTSSGHGTSGLKVISPGPDPNNPGHDVTTWFYTPARLVVLPACDGQPLPPGCPSPTPMPGRDQSRECTNGTYDVSFGGSTPGWVLGTGPSVGQTSEQGTYTVNLYYIQNNI